MQSADETCLELAESHLSRFWSDVTPAIQALWALLAVAAEVLLHVKTAYVWVDALRFEMARELCYVLQDGFDLTRQPALGTIPTITEIGGTIIKDRKDRISFLKGHAGVSVFDAKLDDLLPKPSKKIRAGIKQAQSRHRGRLPASKPKGARVPTSMAVCRRRS